LSDLQEITERIEREEFARGHIAPGEKPATPRPAATLILAWAEPSTTDYRVLLLKRPDTARFAAGAYVFAGGVIDESDSEKDAIDLLPPRLRAPQGHALVAALRELFEETGILLADGPVKGEEARAARGDLLNGELSFAGAARRLGATFTDLQARYLSRWVTPARFARRYDTRFFLARPSASFTDLPTPELTDELTGDVWIAPVEAVRRFARGEFPMLFPTRSTLQALSQEPDLDTLLENCAGDEPEPVEPRLLVRGDSVRPVLPGEPGFEEAT
jgi:recombination protein RecT